MDYRWLTFDEIADLLNPALKQQGFAQLNVNPAQPTCRVLGAFEGGSLIEAFAFQFYPVLGPLIKVDNEFRDNGEVSRELATRMTEFFVTAKARGALCIADTPFTERLCKRLGLQEIQSPVYSYIPKDA